MFDELKQLIESMTTLPPQEWDRLSKALQVKKLSTGEAFIRRGDTSGTIGFIKSGLLKAFYITRDGEEYIRNFCEENTFVAAYASLLKGAPANVDIIALEKCDLFTFKYSDFKEFMPKHCCWQELGRVVAEQNYLLREQRQYELLSMNAEERVQSFFTQFGPLASRISQKDLAAYVGITPESLSRLRAKLDIQ